MEVNSLTKLDQATRMLAEVRTIDDAKSIINLAEAARVYARQVELGLEAQNHAAEIKIRAQRKAGEILSTMEKNKGTQNQLSGKDTSGAYQQKAPEDQPQTYADLDISYKDAHQWQTIASVPEDMFEEFIATTKTNDKELTTSGAMRFSREINKDTNPPPMPLDKYRVIYADPPWKYGNTMPDYMGVQDDHYPLMTIPELCEMSVKELAEDNAVLFMWVTSPILEEAFQVIKAWGFEYKSSFVWDKVKHNMGHYNSVRHEFLLVCTRGSCQPDVRKLFDSVVTEERTEHSKKPAVFREIIDTIYPVGKRIELFARTTAGNWYCYGNEIIS